MSRAPVPHDTVTLERLQSMLAVCTSNPLIFFLRELNVGRHDRLAPQTERGLVKNNDPVRTPARVSMS